jgi:hypothetical protein
MTSSTSPRMTEPEWYLPFEALYIGDSFFIPTLKPKEMIYILDTRAKTAKIKVKSYVTSKDGLMGVRCWRVR